MTKHKIRLLRAMATHGLVDAYGDGVVVPCDCFIQQQEEGRRRDV